MEEVKAQGTYRGFKESLDYEFKRTAEGFVKIGYLLKIARDTEILRESGYKTVAEFAQAEYGLTKDIVSRYIAINDRYSEGGYSEYLQERYQSFGVAKLAEMLTLPDAVIESMSPELTKAEIREVKKEIKEEEKISDIEVLLEEKRPEAAADLLNFICQYLHDHKEDFIDLGAAISGIGNPIDAILDVLAPSGVAMKTARIRGIGKLMLSIRGEDMPLELINVRTNEKRSYTWDECVSTIQELYGGQTGKEAWEAFYGEPFEEKTEETTKMPNEPKQTEKPKEEPAAAPEKASMVRPSEVAPAQPKESQVPGQMEVGDYPELLPDSMKPETVDIEIVPGVTAKIEDIDKATAAARQETKKAEMEAVPEHTEEYDEVASAQPKESGKTAEIPNEPAMAVINAEELPATERATHQIRLDHKYFDAVSSGDKSFELRKNDRGYKVGDVLQMMEFDDGRYTGREIKAEVTYMLEGYTGLQEGYCIMAIAVFDRSKEG